VSFQGESDRLSGSSSNLYRPPTRTASVEMIAFSSLFVYGVLIFVLLLAGFISWTLIAILILCKRVFSYLLAWSDQSTLGSKGAILTRVNPAWAALSPLTYLWLRKRRTLPDFSERPRPTLIYLTCLIFGFGVFSVFFTVWAIVPKP
jgi:hypothetical protein